MLGVLIVIIPTVEPTYSLQNIEINRKTQEKWASSPELLGIVLYKWIDLGFHLFGDRMNVLLSVVHKDSLIMW